MSDYPTATVSQCAVLVGGLGTRLGALTAATPKPLLPCGDRPFLAWLLREFIRYGVTDFLLLTGHLSAAVEIAVADIQAALPGDVRITLSQEPQRAGTGGAVFHARQHLHERFLLCNGDSLFDANLAALLADAAHDPAETVGRLLLRRLDDASRFGVVSLEQDRITAFQERPPAGTSGIINGGVYLFRKALVEHLGPNCSLEADVMPRLARDGRLRGTLGSGYFRDIGVPEDFQRAQTEIPRQLHRRALFLDRDGVLNIDHGYVGSRATGSTGSRARARPSAMPPGAAGTSSSSPTSPASPAACTTRKRCAACWPGSGTRHGWRAGRSTMPATARSIPRAPSRPIAGASLAQAGARHAAGPDPRVGSRPRPRSDGGRPGDRHARRRPGRHCRAFVSGRKSSFLPPADPG